MNPPPPYPIFSLSFFSNHPSISNIQPDFLRFTGSLPLASTAIPSLLPKTNITHHPHNLHSIHPRHIPIQPLPPRHPARARVRERDQTLVDLGRAFLHRVGVVGELEEGFAVGAAVADEALVAVSKTGEWGGGEW